jgi:hypothetical protein
VAAIVGVPVAVLAVGVLVVPTSFGDATFASALLPWIVAAAAVAVVSVLVLLLPAEIGMTPPDARDAPVTWLVAPVVAVSLTLVGWLLTLGGADVDQDMAVVVRLAAAALGIATTAELLFRGVLLGHLATKLGLRTAMALSSVLYGAAYLVVALDGNHLAEAAALAASSAGLGFTLAVLAVGLHSIFPGLVLNVAYLFARLHTGYLDELGQPRSVMSLLDPVWIAASVLIAAAAVLHQRDDRPRAY